MHHVDLCFFCFFGIFLFMCHELCAMFSVYKTNTSFLDTLFFVFHISIICDFFSYAMHRKLFFMFFKYSQNQYNLRGRPLTSAHAQVSFLRRYRPWVVIGSGRPQVRPEAQSFAIIYHLKQLFGHAFGLC